MMLFEEGKEDYKRVARPTLPPEHRLDYRIGFLFNFVSSKSTRFDLEPVLFYRVNGVTEYKRISLQVEKGLAFLQKLDDLFYADLLEFSDLRLLQWMTQTGNRFMRNHSGSWAHLSTRELVNLRKHYLEVLQKLWPTLRAWPDLFYLRAGRFSNTQQQRIKLATTSPECRLSAELQGNLIILRLHLFLDGEEAPVNVWGGFMIEKNGTLYLPAQCMLPIFDAFKNGPLSFPVSIKKDVVRQYILPWMESFHVSISAKLNIDVREPAAQPRVRLSELNESNLMIRPEFAYDDFEVDYSEERYHLGESASGITIIKRDNATEKQLYEYLRTLHPSFTTQRNNQYYYLPFDDVMKRGWFIAMLRKVQGEGLSIRGFETLQKFRYSTHDPVITFTAVDSTEWFELNVAIRWGEQHVPLKDIRHAILGHQDTIMLEDGSLGHIPETWIGRYSLLLRTATEENGKLRISKMHFTLLEDLLGEIEGQALSDEIADRKNKLVAYDSLPKTPLSNQITASLRPYQLSGFHWLQMLNELGWGGCLADDMGLGKTLQAISFLQYVKEKYAGSTQLVVCPTSLIFNWENELQKFCPSLKYHVHYGAQRELGETHFTDFDLVLTTYGIVRSDVEELSRFLWQYVILDESQAIKNPDAQVTKAVRQLAAANRIILSGTPIQNNTSDLFAQFSFLNPGLLGNREYFNREFAVPIDKLGSQEKTRELKKLIYPFTLRRTKEQVAKDLPDKTVSVLWCTMEADQRRLYNHYREGYRKRLFKKIDEEGIAKSGMDVLEALLRLRQICDHPALVDPAAEAIPGSVKIEELIREVQENAGDHKVLVFSQFTQMLQLIKEEFEKAGITYCYLDGKTPLPKRKEQVTQFQEDENIKAFLISLKAGGVGLNLTVADYVYLVDPWWNPAAEQQAIDRAHRIGQKRNVFAYKMICKDTVEEKILKLQEKKQLLADDLIQEDSGFVKNLSREDIDFLLG
jgi:SNF2 family DNA or RNA helicase